MPRNKPNQGVGRPIQLNIKDIEGRWTIERLHAHRLTESIW